MPPNQGQPAGGQDPYAFIMQDAPKQKRSLLPSGNSRKQRLLYGFGLLGVLGIFGIILMIIFTSGGSSMATMVEIAQTQNEIIRVTNTANTQIKGASTLAFDQNTLLTITSDQKTTLAYISDFQKVPDAKTLALKTDSNTDTQLKEASQSSRYDETFATILVKQLTDYQAELNDAFKGTSDPAQRELLKTLYDHVTVLLKSQSPTTN